MVEDTPSPGGDPAEGSSPLTPAELNVLLALAGGDLHGYGIMKEVERRTGGKTRLGPGTLYRSVKQMLGRGWIEEVGDRPDPGSPPGDDRRRYYRLTGSGRRAASAELARLEELVAAGRSRGLPIGFDPGPSLGGSG